MFIQEYVIVVSTCAVNCNVLHVLILIIVEIVIQHCGKVINDLLYLMRAVKVVTVNENNK